MLNFIKQKLTKIYSHVGNKLHQLFSKETIDAETLTELEKILISSDTGFSTTQKILTHLKQKVASGTIAKGDDLHKALQEELLSLLQPSVKKDCSIFLLVGVNGSGKTTFAGKLAHANVQQGKKVLLVAADTFRAAAPEQLTQWAKKTNSDIVLGNLNQDPASVVFKGCEKFKQDDYDILIIDTAGRLQTKTNLMKELEKIKGIISKHFPDQNICTLLTIDAMLGQNSFEQAQLFNESTNVDGIVLTKMDGTGKGGIVFAINNELNIPISYISFGEQLGDLKLFNSKEYVSDLLK